MSDLRNYFAYGSNMDLAQLRERVGNFPEPASARLDGYCLCFNKIAQDKPGVGYANIIHARDRYVEGVCYRVTAAQLTKLSKIEGVLGCHYREETVEVSVMDPATRNVTVTKAVTYIACEGKLGDGLLPEQRYMEHLLAGERYLSPAYFAMLKRQPTK